MGSLTCEESMSGRVIRRWRREEQAQRGPEASGHHGFEERLGTPLLQTVLNLMAQSVVCPAPKTIGRPIGYDFDDGSNLAYVQN